MKIFERISKRRAIKSYVKTLPPLLKKRYGKHKKYTEGQVRKTVKAAGLNNKFIDLALAMYISRDEFNLIMKSREIPLDYTDARREIAYQHFDGNLNFTIHDAIEVSNSGAGFLGGSSDTGGAGYDSDGND